MARAMIVAATLPVDRSFWRNKALLEQASRYFEHGAFGPDRLSAPIQNHFAFPVAEASAASPVVPPAQPPGAAKIAEAAAA